MAASLEETLIVRCGAMLVEEAKTVTLEGGDFPVRITLSGRRYLALRDAPVRICEFVISVIEISLRRE
ncbi:MAG: hypothetical protein LAP86_10540 [Acidobacteriia bacterium]|nr:hypothetical protein [Terriglobia bacterium]